MFAAWNYYHGNGVSKSTFYKTYILWFTENPCSILAEYFENCVLEDVGPGEGKKFGDNQNTNSFQEFLNVCWLYNFQNESQYGSFILQLFDLTGGWNQ